MATIGLTLTAGMAILTPAHLAEAGTSAAFAALSLSNVDFTFAGGHFGAEAEIAPLLHAWSLSVEAQFYLVWTLALVGLMRLGGRRLVPAAVGWRPLGQMLRLTAATAAGFAVQAAGGLPDRMALTRRQADFAAASGFHFSDLNRDGILTFAAGEAGVETGARAQAKPSGRPLATVLAGPAAGS